METIKLKKTVKYRESIVIDGKRIKGPSFTKKSSATQWKAQILIEREKAKLYGSNYREIKRLKLSEYGREWLDRKIKAQKSESTFLEYKRIIFRKVIPIIGDKYLDSYLEDDANKLISALKDRGHNTGGINKILAVFKQVLRQAEKNDIILKSGLKNVSKLKETKMAANYWQRSDINQFLLAIKDHFLYPFFVVALHTGLRRGELCGLQWSKIDFTRSMIEVSAIRDKHGFRPTTKSKKVRFVPMNPIVKATLLKLHESRQNDFVFIRPNGTLIPAHHCSRDFKKLQVKAEIQNIIGVHGLRHTFASHFMMNGGNIYDLQKILGHSKLEMTNIYAHLSPQHLAKSTEIVDFCGDKIES